MSEDKVEFEGPDSSEKFWFAVLCIFIGIGFLVVAFSIGEARGNKLTEMEKAAEIHGLQIQLLGIDQDWRALLIERELAVYNSHTGAFELKDLRPTLFLKEPDLLEGLPAEDVGDHGKKNRLLPQWKEKR